MKLHNWELQVPIAGFDLYGPVLDLDIPEIPDLYMLVDRKPVEGDPKAHSLVYSFRGREKARNSLLTAILGENYTFYQYVSLLVDAVDAGETGFNPIQQRGMRLFNGGPQLEIGSLSDIVWLKAGDKLGNRTVLKDGFVKHEIVGFCGVPNVRWPQENEGFLLGPPDILSPDPNPGYKQSTASPYELEALTLGGDDDILIVTNPDKPPPA